MSRTSRSHDIVPRMGGKEFSIILQDCNHELAIQIARTLCETVKNYPFQLQDRITLNITISIGAATYLEPTFNAGQLVHQADAVLYKAKNTGRNNVCSVYCL